jgi:hypothetical protein
MAAAWSEVSTGISRDRPEATEIAKVESCFFIIIIISTVFYPSKT